MKNDFSTISERLDALKCPVCQGLGECDDADMGDIMFNTWTCRTCHGSGMKQRGDVAPVIERLIAEAYEQFDEGAEDCVFMEAVDLIISNDLEQTKIRVTEEMSETADSWQGRCDSFLSILGLDFGQNDPKPVLDGKVLKTADQIRNEAYVEAFDTIFQVIDMLKQETVKNG